MTERPARRVPHVREVAVAGEFALIGGYAAWFLARLLEGYPAGLERLVARSGLSPDRRADIFQAARALADAGARWRLEHDGRGSSSGTLSGGEQLSNVRSSRDQDRVDDPG